MEILFAVSLFEVVEYVDFLYTAKTVYYKD